MSGTPWKPQEIEYLELMYHKCPISQIAKHLHRTNNSVQRKAQALGLTKPNTTPHTKWSEDEILFLNRYYETRGAAYVAKKLHRSLNSVKRKAQREYLNTYINEFLSMKQIANAFQCDCTVVHSWIDKFELPMKQLKFKSYTQYRITPEQFWQWAKFYKSMIPWRNYKRYSILPEPKWLSYEIQQDFDNRHREKISIYDVNYVIRKRQNGMTFASIAKNLNRTENSVKHIWRKYRPHT